jgi:hypothetical protein
MSSCITTTISVSSPSRTRHIKDPLAWSCLATMAIAEKELNTAEVAFAAVDMVCTPLLRVMFDV